MRLSAESAAQVYADAVNTTQPRRKLSIHNTLLKTYAAALNAKYGNPQDNPGEDSEANMQEGDNTPMQIKVDSELNNKTQLALDGMREDISRLTKGMQQLEHNNRSLSQRQDEADKILADKLIHIYNQ